MSTRRRAGFSLFELLTLLGVGGLLFGLFFPAVLKTRAAALRASSSNNLKQIALAVLNHEAATGSFPKGRDDQGFSAHAFILPYLEQDNLYKMIDFTKPIDNEKNLAVRKMEVRTYVDERDKVGRPKDEFGPTNYLFNAGSKPALKENDGLLFQGSKIRITDVTDGTSNTILTGSTLRGDRSKDAVNVRRQYVKLDADALKTLNDDSGVEDFKKDQHIAGDRGGSWMDGSFLQTLFTATRLPDDPKPDVSCGGIGGLSGLRTLDGVLLIGMSDGSVRTTDTKKMKLETFKALCTRAGNETISPSDF